MLHLDVCSTAACAVPEDGLQQLVVHLECLSTSASAAPRRVCLQELLFAPEVSADCIEPVLHLRVSVYKSSVLHLEVSVFKSMCCTCACLSTRALCCTCACVSTRVLCCTWTCLPTRVLEEHNCFDTCSKHRNKSKNKFFGFTKQTEKQPKQNVFRFYSVQTENIFRLLRGHPC